MADLITLDEYKLAKGLSKTDNDDRIEQLITNVSSLIQTYIGKKLIDSGEDIVETISLDYDTDVIYLDAYPITSLVSVTEINSSYWDSTVHFPVSSSNFFVDNKNGKLLRLGGRYWSKGPSGVVVTYRAGSEDATAVPPELKQATIDLVTYYLKEEYKDNKQLRGATLNNNTGQGNGNNPSTSFPPHIQRVLDLYR